MKYIKYTLKIGIDIFDEITSEQKEEILILSNKFQNKMLKLGDKMNLGIVGDKVKIVRER